MLISSLKMVEVIKSSINNAHTKSKEAFDIIRYGSCLGCYGPNTFYSWCPKCYAKRFQQDFPNWSSGNEYIDKFVQETQLNTKNRHEFLEWIPYNRLTNIKYLAKGGFSTVYKAIWLDGRIEYWDFYKDEWFRNSRERKVVIKSLNNSSIINDEFLNEWKIHFDCYKKTMKLNPHFVPLFGFTQDPNSLDYMIVMEYAGNGSLRNSLNRDRFDWRVILNKLIHLISGLNAIHESNLVHCDLHDGNILLGIDGKLYISDLGLCKPMDYYKLKSKHDVYGVLPYMAPEVLRGKPFTSASDIYSFAIIMWEFTSAVPPFCDRVHDFHLSLSICKGERPKIIEGTPQFYIDLMKKCWDSDPLKRPKASEIKSIIESWNYSIYKGEFRNLNTELRNINVEYHPQAHNISHLVDFTKKLDDIIEKEKEIYGYENDINQDIGVSRSIEILNLTEEDIFEALKDVENETQSDEKN